MAASQGTPSGRAQPSNPVDIPALEEKLMTTDILTPQGERPATLSEAVNAALDKSTGKVKTVAKMHGPGVDVHVPDEELKSIMDTMLRPVDWRIKEEKFEKLVGPDLVTVRPDAEVGVLYVKEDVTHPFLPKRLALPDELVLSLPAEIVTYVEGLGVPMEIDVPTPDDWAATKYDPEELAKFSQLDHLAQKSNIIADQVASKKKTAPAHFDTDDGATIEFGLMSARPPFPMEATGATATGLKNCGLLSHLRWQTPDRMQQWYDEVYPGLAHTRPRKAYIREDPDDPLRQYIVSAIPRRELSAQSFFSWSRSMCADAFPALQARVFEGAGGVYEPSKTIPVPFQAPTALAKTVNEINALLSAESGARFASKFTAFRACPGIGKIAITVDEGSSSMTKALLYASTLVFLKDLDELEDRGKRAITAILFGLGVSATPDAVEALLKGHSGTESMRRAYGDDTDKRASACYNGVADFLAAIAARPWERVKFYVGNDMYGEREGIWVPKARGPEGESPYISELDVAFYTEEDRWQGSINAIRMWNQKVTNRLLSIFRLLIPSIDQRQAAPFSNMVNATFPAALVFIFENARMKGHLPLWTGVPTMNTVRWPAVEAASFLRYSTAEAELVMDGARLAEMYKAQIKTYDEHVKGVVSGISYYSFVVEALRRVHGCHPLFFRNRVDLLIKTTQFVIGRFMTVQPDLQVLTYLANRVKMTKVINESFHRHFHMSTLLSSEPDPTYVPMPAPLYVIEVESERNILFMFNDKNTITPGYLFSLFEFRVSPFIRKTSYRLAVTGAFKRIRPAGMYLRPGAAIMMPDAPSVQVDAAALVAVGLENLYVPPLFLDDPNYILVGKRVKSDVEFISSSHDTLNAMVIRAAQDSAHRFDGSLDSKTSRGWTVALTPDATLIVGVGQRAVAASAPAAVVTIGLNNTPAFTNRVPFAMENDLAQDEWHGLYMNRGMLDEIHRFYVRKAPMKIVEPTYDFEEYVTLRTQV